MLMRGSYEQIVVSTIVTVTMLKVQGSRRPLLKSSPDNNDVAEAMLVQAISGP